MFVSQKKVAGVNPITDRKVVICPKVQPRTSRTLSEIYATSHRPPLGYTKTAELFLQVVGGGGGGAEEVRESLTSD